MKTRVHRENNVTVVEVIDDAVLIKTAQDALEVMMSVSYGFDATKLILHRKHLASDFFDLKTGLAGELHQKLANYRMQLGIVGNVDDIESKNFRAFVTEANNGNQLFFSATLEAAKNNLMKRHL